MNQMSTISMNNVAGFKSDVNAKGDTAAQITQAMEKPVNNLGFVPKSNMAPRLDTVEGGAKQVTVSADALEKMLEMFELVLKAMRNFLSGWGGSSKLPVDVQSPPVTLVKSDVQMKAGAEGNVQVSLKDADTQSKPARAETGAQVKLGADGGLQIDLKDADTQVLPKNQEQAVKVKLGAEQGVQLSARTDSPAPVAQGIEKDASLDVSADGDAQVTVMPDGSTQVNLTPESGKQYRISLAAGVQVKVTSHDGSSTASSIKPRLIIDEAKVGEPDGAALITETRTANPLRAEAKTLAATPSAFKTEAEMKADAEGKVDTALDAGAQTTTAAETVHEHEHTTAAHKDAKRETTVGADSEIKVRPGIRSPAPAAGHPIFGRFG
ncbi:MULTISPECIES: hypothetical protein [Pseudomonas]|uniref:hypothetical protein n=1 Tax=Pseudomonas TaxID=286 RepID=UPI001AE9AF84|nr:MULTISPECIES: hypothetical protein [unclassified Pseudomonas]MBP1125260.1 hypothetical protein [Pseudomonas sp. PvP025]MDQ0399120.1 hypothetical protein [Pseudomonas sp. PvP006]